MNYKYTITLLHNKLFYIKVLLLTTLSFFTFSLYLVIIFFLINCNNLLTLILFSEIIWVLLYSLTIVVGNVSDELTLITSSFLFLALASLEFCLGFIISIFFKNFIKFFDFNFLNFFFKGVKNNNIYLYKYTNIL